MGEYKCVSGCGDDKRAHMCIRTASPTPVPTPRPSPVPTSQQSTSGLEPAQGEHVDADMSFSSPGGATPSDHGGIDELSATEQHIEADIAATEQRAQRHIRAAESRVAASATVAAAQVTAAAALEPDGLLASNDFMTQQKVAEIAVS